MSHGVYTHRDFGRDLKEQEISVLVLGSSYHLVPYEITSEVKP